MLAKVQMKRDQIRDLEEWFLSPTYEILTELDPHYLIKKLREEAGLSAQGGI